jgi:hypothetical protein
MPTLYRAHSIRLKDAALETVDGFGATLAVGHVVFYAAVGYNGPLRMRLRSEAAATLKEIWPGRGHVVRWPPPLLPARMPGTGVSTLVAQSCVILDA